MVNKLFKGTFIFTILFCTVAMAQNLEENKIGKNDFVEQAIKELEKAKQLNVKTRFRYAGFYEADGITLQEKVLSEKLSFDKNGKRKELIRYQGNGDVDQKFTFQHDTKGRFSKLETRNTGNYVVGKRESKYDKAGNEIERKLYDVRRGNFKVLFKYDKDGNIIESKNFDKNNKFNGRYENTFENGSAKKTIVYQKDGKVRREVWYFYNNAGQLVREEIKDLSNSYSVSYTHDTNGNITEIVTPQSKRIVTYNEKNDILEDKMYTTDGTRQYRVVFSYLENGLQKDEIRYDNSEIAAFHVQIDYEFYK